MRTRFIFLQGVVFTSALGIAIASSSWQTENPQQWTSEDVYQILNSSPWSKPVDVTVSRGAEYGNPDSRNGGNGGTWGSGGQMPGGIGRGGWGGGGPFGGGGMGRRRGGYPSGRQETATVQWASALPVRLAEAKSHGGSADESAMKPMEQYVIAVIGLPKSEFAAEWTGRDSDDESDDASLAEHFKVITVLSFGHERINPTKVEFNQGRDGRTLFYFEKSEPITLREKNVEFRITGRRAELRKKFVLKDMEYQGKLEL